MRKFLTMLVAMVLAIPTMLAQNPLYVLEGGWYSSFNQGIELEYDSEIDFPQLTYDAVSGTYSGTINAWNGALGYGTIFKLYDPVTATYYGRSAIYNNMIQPAGNTATGLLSSYDASAVKGFLTLYAGSFRGYKLNLTVDLNAGTVTLTPGESFTEPTAYGVLYTTNKSQTVSGAPSNPLNGLMLPYSSSNVVQCLTYVPDKSVYPTLYFKLSTSATGLTTNTAVYCGGVAGGNNVLTLTENDTPSTVTVRSATGPSSVQFIELDTPGNCWVLMTYDIDANELTAKLVNYTGEEEDDDPFASITKTEKFTSESFTGGKVTFKWGSNLSGTTSDAADNGTLQAYVTDAEGTQYNVTMSNVNYSAEPPTLIFDLNSIITYNGDYTLTVPEGFFNFYDSNSYEAVAKSAAIEYPFTWTLGEDPEDDDPFAGITKTENYSSASFAGGVVTFTWKSGLAGTTNVLADKDELQAFVTDEQGEITYIPFDGNVDLDFEPPVLTIDLNSVIKYNGEYTLTVPESYVFFMNNMDYEPESKSPLIEYPFTWTLGEDKPGDEPATGMAPTSKTGPTDGKITFTWGSPVTEIGDSDEAYKGELPIVLKSADGSFTREIPYNFDNDWKEKIGPIFIIREAKNGEVPSIIVDLTSILTSADDGKQYTLTVPEGFVDIEYMLNGSKAEDVNAQIVYPFTWTAPKEEDKYDNYGGTLTVLAGPIIQISWNNAHPAILNRNVMCIIDGGSLSEPIEMGAYSDGSKNFIEFDLSSKKLSAGEYTVTIPANYLNFNIDWQQTYNTKPMQFPFTISATTEPEPEDPYTYSIEFSSGYWNITVNGASTISKGSMSGAYFENIETGVKYGDLTYYDGYMYSYNFIINGGMTPNVIKLNLDANGLSGRMTSGNYKLVVPEGYIKFNGVNCPAFEVSGITVTKVEEVATSQVVEANMKFNNQLYITWVSVNGVEVNKINIAQDQKIKLQTPSTQLDLAYNTNFTLSDNSIVVDLNKLGNDLEIGQTYTFTIPEGLVLCNTNDDNQYLNAEATVSFVNAEVALQEQATWDPLDAKFVAGEDAIVEVTWPNATAIAHIDGAPEIKATYSTFDSSESTPLVFGEAVTISGTTLKINLKGLPALEEDDANYVIDIPQGYVTLVIEGTTYINATTSNTYRMSAGEEEGEATWSIEGQFNAEMTVDGNLVNYTGSPTFAFLGQIVKTVGDKKTYYGPAGDSNVAINAYDSYQAVENATASWDFSGVVIPSDVINGTNKVSITLNLDNLMMTIEKIEAAPAVDYVTFNFVSGEDQNISNPWNEVVIDLEDRPIGDAWFLFPDSESMQVNITEGNTFGFRPAVIDDYDLYVTVTGTDAANYSMKKDNSETYVSLVPAAAGAVVTVAVYNKGEAPKGDQITSVNLNFNVTGQGVAASASNVAVSYYDRNAGTNVNVNESNGQLSADNVGAGWNFTIAPQSGYKIVNITSEPAGMIAVSEPSNPNGEWNFTVSQNLTAANATVNVVLAEADPMVTVNFAGAGSSYVVATGFAANNDTGNEIYIPTGGVTFSVVGNTTSYDENYAVTAVSITKDGQPVALTDLANYGSSYQEINGGYSFTLSQQASGLVFTFTVTQTALTEGNEIEFNFTTGATSDPIAGEVYSHVSVTANMAGVEVDSNPFTWIYKADTELLDILLTPDANYSIAVTASAGEVTPQANGAVQVSFNSTEEAIPANVTINVEVTYTQPSVTFYFATDNWDYDNFYIYNSTTDVGENPEEAMLVYKFDGNNNLFVSYNNFDGDFELNVTVEGYDSIEEFNESGKGTLENNDGTWNLTLNNSSNGLEFYWSATEAVSPVPTIEATFSLYPDNPYGDDPVPVDELPDAIVISYYDITSGEVIISDFENKYDEYYSATAAIPTGKTIELTPAENYTIADIMGGFNVSSIEKPGEGENMWRITINNNPSSSTVTYSIFIAKAEEEEGPDQPGSEAIVIYQNGTSWDGVVMATSSENALVDEVAEGPDGATKVLSFSAAGLYGEYDDAQFTYYLDSRLDCPQFVDKYLNFDWYAVGGATYSLVLRAGSTGFVKYELGTVTGKAANIPAGTWVHESLNVAELFPTVNEGWKTNGGIGQNQNVVFGLYINQGSEGDVIYINNVTYTDEPTEAPEQPSEPGVQPTGMVVVDDFVLTYVKGTEEGDSADVDVNVVLDEDFKEGDLVYQGFQFDVTLPEGMSVESATSFLGNASVAKQTSGNTYRVMARGNSVPGGNTGYTQVANIATLNIVATYEALAAPGSYPAYKDVIVIDNSVFFSTTTGDDIMTIRGSESTVTIIDGTNYAAELTITGATLVEPSYSNAAGNDEITALTVGEDLSLNGTLKYTDDLAQNPNVEPMFFTIEVDGEVIAEGEDGYDYAYFNDWDPETGAMSVVVLTEDLLGSNDEVEVTVTVAIGEKTASWTFTVRGILLGDSNFSDKVTVADVVTTANFLADVESTRFDFPNANVMDDEEIMVDDVTATVEIVLGTWDGKRNVRRQARQMATGDVLTVDNFRVNNDAPFTVAVGLDNTHAYAAIQAEVEVPAGMTVKNVTTGARAANHSLVWNKLENGNVMVVIYSETNASIKDVEGSLFNLEVVADAECAGISIDRIFAADAHSIRYELGYTGGNNESVTTGVDGIDAENGDVRYFTVDGVEIRNPEAGQIVIRVEGDKVEKVVVK